MIARTGGLVLSIHTFTPHFKPSGGEVQIRDVEVGVLIDWEDELGTALREQLVQRGKRVFLLPS